MPELTRDEILGGRRIKASPAKPPHALQQTRLDYVIEAHVAPGYRAATDLLTRHDEESDFASDTCVLRQGTDPETGTRYLEEIAFEVISEQNEAIVTEKALRMYRRGVRRIFAIRVKGQQVCEWSSETRSWRVLEPDTRIEDPCLVTPVSVTALLEAAAADRAVVEALAAKGSPALRERETTAEARGWAEGQAAGMAEGRAVGMAEAVASFLEARGVPLTEAQRQEILRCRDLDQLGCWLQRAALASSADEVFAEP